MELSAYTAEECVVACANYNSWHRQRICTSITFSALMSERWTWGLGHCWLFNGTSGTINISDDPKAALAISAILATPAQ